MVKVMPIYKMNSRKNGLQKYQVRLNYKDKLGKARQIDRVAYGLEEAKTLERQLSYNIKNENPHKNMTLGKLFNEYMQMKHHEIKETSIDAIEKK